MMGPMGSMRSTGGMGSGSMPLDVLGTALLVLFWAWVAWEIGRVVVRRRRHAPTTARLRAVVPWRGTRFTPPRAEPKISHSTQAREPELTSLREIAI